MRKFREVTGTPSPRKRFEVQMSGPDLLHEPFLNKGDAFATQERATFGQTGLLPEAVTTLDEQVKRAYLQYQQQPDDPRKNIYLNMLQDSDEVKDWRHDMPQGGISLAEVVRQVHPTMLIGTSTAPGTFTESIVKDMAAHTQRPIIFPLSNPTQLMEATSSDLITWTDGRALVATGIPSHPVTYKGTTYVIGQANNALLYPGLGLGTIVARASQVSDGMFTAAAKAVADQVDAKQPGASLLPHVDNLRAVSATVAVEVARTAASEQLARVELTNVIQQVQDAMWQPEYPELLSSVAAGSRT